MPDIDELVPGNCSVRLPARVPCKTRKAAKRDATPQSYSRICQGDQNTGKGDGVMTVFECLVR
ncbi:hypothetical protein E2C01_096447 [Portunus trituberculatus]|uniref:Uncharacterized protein n=1 Tax=Portunus trituberculatus TaxID=210409 RepID=A0A5B7JVM8_PORTR|nr:hypothetical protein [Portunus trituberculatus]